MVFFFVQSSVWKDGEVQKDHIKREERVADVLKTGLKGGEAKNLYCTDVTLPDYQRQRVSTEVPGEGFGISNAFVMS